eukprot:m.207636 g.207636  ORF g.207636 m.207636 type:complete len:56 (-) comp18933_c1_seq1:888-1055(-)
MDSGVDREQRYIQMDQDTQENGLVGIVRGVGRLQLQKGARMKVDFAWTGWKVGVG